jgi:hypothetical protein
MAYTVDEILNGCRPMLSSTQEDAAPDERQARYEREEDDLYEGMAQLMERALPSFSLFSPRRRRR